MKRSLFTLGVLCSLAAICLPSCKESAPTKTGAERAPELVKRATTKAPVHPEILALGQEMKRGQDAYDAVRQRMFALPRGLSREDAGALLDLLLTSPGGNWNELGWAAIVNDGCNILREMKNQPDGFMEKLVTLHRDGTRPAVIRDYALQHFGTQLAAYYRDPAGRGRMLYPDDQGRRAAEEALRAALSPGGNAANATNATAGTACNVAGDILTACRTSGATPPISADELNRACRETALSPAANLHARLSALGMLGRHRSPAALKEARGWMLDGSQPVLLRAAAISYAGQFSLETDRDALTTLATDTDMRLALPAKEVLKRLEGK